MPTLTDFLLRWCMWCRKETVHEVCVTGGMKRDGELTVISSVQCLKCKKAESRIT